MRDYRLKEKRKIPNGKQVKGDRDWILTDRGY
jgi:hypothetical protein